LSSIFPSLSLSTCHLFSSIPSSLPLSTSRPWAEPGAQHRRGANLGIWLHSRDQPAVQTISPPLNQDPVSSVSLRGAVFFRLVSPMPPSEESWLNKLYAMRVKDFGPPDLDRALHILCSPLFSTSGLVSPLVVPVVFSRCRVFLPKNPSACFSTLLPFLSVKKNPKTRSRTSCGPAAVQRQKAAKMPRPPPDTKTHKCWNSMHSLISTTGLSPEHRSPCGGRLFFLLHKKPIYPPSFFLFTSCFFSCFFRFSLNFPNETTFMSAPHRRGRQSRA